MHDLLWIQAMPAMAAIYYHSHLTKSHALYCPDEQMHIRDIARSIFRVMDSNNKKVVIHFMRPCTDTKRDNLLRFLYKCRPRLCIDCIAIPSTAFQTMLLSGWAAALDNSLWQRRCQAPFEASSFQLFATQSGQSSVVDAYNTPFCVTDKILDKNALLVDIKIDMLRFSLETGLKLNDATQSALQGWIDASLTMELDARTLILIVDEQILFGAIPQFRSMTSQSQKHVLEERRAALFESVKTLTDQIPVYLLCHDYCHLETSNLGLDLAWLQHRHHLCLSKSIYMTWSKDSNQFPDSPQYVSSMTTVYLSMVAKQSRVKWKSDFIQMLQKFEKSNLFDPLLPISPTLLELPLHPMSYLMPLLCDWTDEILTAVEVVESHSARHCAVIANRKVADAWKQHLQHVDTVKPDLNYATVLGTDVVTLGDSNNEPEFDIEDFAQQLDEITIQDYIKHAGAYGRGSTILHTLDQLSFDGNAQEVVLSCEAKGTSDAPYNVAVGLKRHLPSEKTSVIHGICNCPVGKEGRCKHCTALLLRFKINADEFERDKSIKIRVALPTEISSEINPTSSHVTRTAGGLENGSRVESDISTSEAVAVSLVKPTASRTGRRKLPWAKEQTDMAKPAKKGKTSKKESTQTPKSSESKNTAKSKRKVATAGCVLEDNVAHLLDNDIMDIDKPVQQTVESIPISNVLTSPSTHSLVAREDDTARLYSGHDLQPSPLTALDLALGAHALTDSDDETDDGTGTGPVTLSSSNEPSLQSNERNEESSSAKVLEEQLKLSDKQPVNSQETPGAAEARIRKTTAQLFDELDL